MQSEAEEVADRKTDDPIADDVDDEAGVGVAGAAEGAGGGDLEAVEELEDGGDEEKGMVAAMTSRSVVKLAAMA
ncbi:hypothetical protein RBB80_13590 [Tunturiibacter gelidiferens]